MNTSADVIIVGAGIVGATLAQALLQQGFRVVLVDRRAPQMTWPETATDARVSAVTRASENIFRHLGVWDEMAMTACPFREMVVWESSAGGELRFKAAEIASDALGHIVENRVIVRAVHRALAQYDDRRLQCFFDTAVVTLRHGPESISLTLASGERIGARLLVGADGRDSQIRRLSAISTYGWSYDQSALVVNVRPERDHRETAWQRFLATGPLAFLPLQDGLCTVVWSNRSDEVQRLLELPAKPFASALAEAFDHRLGTITAVGPRAAFALRFQLARQYLAQRTVLIGDAAHTVHPLAGQGANLGLADAAALAEALAEAKASGRDFGAHAVLRRYERARKSEVLLFSAAIEGVKRAYGMKAPGFALLRRFGVRAVNRAGPVNHGLMRRAMGLTGDLPALARYG